MRVALLLLCLSLGSTTACRPKTDADCRASKECKADGKCSYDSKKRACVAEQDDEPSTEGSDGKKGTERCKAQCAGSGECEETTETYADDKSGDKDSLHRVHSCIASKPEHCKNADVCKTLGWCTLSNKRCVGGSDAECKASTECASLGNCKLSSVDTICVPASDADCAASQKCKSHGHCVAQFGSKGAVEGCGVKSNDLCKKVPACKRNGACNAVHGRGSIMRCQPQSAADCAQSDLCKTEGACSFLDRGCVKL